MWSLSLWHNLHKTCCVHARLATADHSKAEKTIFATQAFLIGNTCVLRLAETYYAVTNGASWRCASFCQFWWLECESNENKRSPCKSMLTIHRLDYGFPCQLQMLHAFMTSFTAHARSRVRYYILRRVISLTSCRPDMSCESMESSIADIC